LGDIAIAKGEKTAAKLNVLAKENRVSFLEVDASNPKSLDRAFNNIDLVVVASSTTKYTKNVAEIALEKKIDSFDILYSANKREILTKMKDKIKEKGLCFITDGGFHPGIPAAMAFFLATQFEKDSMKSCIFNGLMKIDYNATMIKATQNTKDEFIEIMMGEEFHHFEQGKWVQRKVPKMADIDFGPKYGKETVITKNLDELKEIPEKIPSLKDLSISMGGFPWQVNYLGFPLCILA